MHDGFVADEFSKLVHTHKITRVFIRLPAMRKMQQWRLLHESKAWQWQPLLRPNILYTNENASCFEAF